MVCSSAPGTETRFSPTLVIIFLIILFIAGIALLVWTIVDAHQRQRNNQPRSKYWFARLMAASIGILFPVRFVLSTPAFIFGIQAWTILLLPIEIIAVLTTIFLSKFLEARANNKVKE